MLLQGVGQLALASDPETHSYSLFLGTTTVPGKKCIIHPSLLSVLSSLSHSLPFTHPFLHPFAPPPSFTLHSPVRSFPFLPCLASHPLLSLSATSPLCHSLPASTPAQNVKNNQHTQDCYIDKVAYIDSVLLSFTLSQKPFLFSQCHPLLLPTHFLLYLASPFAC